ncbi:GNAT family N-acetyltransferase [Pseudoroseicyclus aestuarii]|uniref:Acetyltransferase (GNAT) family protein n=1 Tax=Pseudoroseicyclus aestuarii TaxID=1795041 RepID=A0A318SVD4_9RHOB|nr:GNAT family N-acetyltransferase [Pseudoroseicyclus aestuarii]PYE84319.1 acetyltransferase (GNAT) family protein [Pseudoroseicyclus aestuarii]
MQIERIEEARLTPELEAELGALLDLCFSGTFEGRSFFMQRHHVRLIAREEAIIGHMALSLRAIRLGEDLATIAGLAEVATHPDRRGEGIAGRLMEAMLEEARAMPADFLLLFGDRPIYAGHGFVPAPNPLRWVEMAGARTGWVAEGSERGLMVLPLGARAWDDDAPVDLLGHLF